MPFEWVSMRLLFQIIPSDSDLGPAPHNGKPVDYELTVQPDGKPWIETVPFPDPLDVEVDLAEYRHLEIRVRFPWAHSERLKDFQQPYTVR
jgi:hypothetical protein